jgi:hypothetical protein
MCAMSKVARVPLYLSRSRLYDPRSIVMFPCLMPSTQARLVLRTHVVVYHIVPDFPVRNINVRLRIETMIILSVININSVCVSMIAQHCNNRFVAVPISGQV